MPNATSRGAEALTSPDVNILVPLHAARPSPARRQVSMRISVFILLASTLCAQTFEVTSVKPNHSGSYTSSSPRLTKGTLSATNTTVMAMLQIAYDLSPIQITGPAWITTDRFDLSAKSPAEVPDTEIQPMLQALLKDRFQMTAHLDTKEMPVYNMVIAKEGLKIKVYDPNAPVAPHPAQMPGAYGATEARQTMPEIARTLAFAAGRPVIDKTGLEGRYYYFLQYGQLGNGPDQAPDIFDAVQQQLGLRLEPAKAPVQLLVIDRIERAPTEN